MDLELTRGLTRKGRVVDPDGKPVAGARCYGLVSTWGFIKTLPDETFEVHGLEPGYPRQVIFAHKGRRLVGAVILKDEDLESEAPLEVRLGPPCSVKGRLVDEDGLPLAGATLSVMSYYGPGGHDSLPPGPDALWPDDETFTADSDGRFEVNGLKPGVRCFIGVQHQGPTEYPSRHRPGLPEHRARTSRRGPRPRRGEGQGRGRVIGPGRRSRCGPILIRRSRATPGRDMSPTPMRPGTSAGSSTCTAGPASPPPGTRSGAT